MSIETIDAGILAHRSWVSRFKTALQGINTEIFDLPSTIDDSACDLGSWLATDSARLTLGAQAHDEIQPLHVRFHQVCGELAAQLNQRSVNPASQAVIEELDSVSKQIVKRLIRAKARA
jgi:hypothetical protein